MLFVTEELSVDEFKFANEKAVVSSTLLVSLYRLSNSGNQMLPAIQTAIFSITVRGCV